ncbi:hypothetical protein J6590_020797 [Homalodisca vitripennis]|nr:hypothetical protein J6590_020797 [Homalodisca vitripennis]
MLSSQRVRGRGRGKCILSTVRFREQDRTGMLPVDVKVLAGPGAAQIPIQELIRFQPAACEKMPGKQISTSTKSVRLLRQNAADNKYYFERYQQIQYMLAAKIRHRGLILNVVFQPNDREMLANQVFSKSKYKPSQSESRRCHAARLLVDHTSHLNSIDLSVVLEGGDHILRNTREERRRKKRRNRRSARPRDASCLVPSLSSPSPLLPPPPVRSLDRLGDDRSRTTPHCHCHLVQYGFND